MTELPDIDAFAAMLGITLQPEWHASVRANIEISLRLAGVVMDFPLDDEADMAPVFNG